LCIHAAAYYFVLSGLFKNSKENSKHLKIALETKKIKTKGNFFSLSLSGFWPARPHPFYSPVTSPLAPSPVSFP
jgi:hypothetical protein